MKDGYYDRETPEPAQPITQADATNIVRSMLTQNAAKQPLHCFEHKPSNFHIYDEPNEPCWWIVAPWQNGMDALTLRSSRVILVGRETGIIYYDGSAYDEG